MNRYISLDLAVLQILEKGIKYTVNCAYMRKPVPQFVTTADTNGFAVERFMVRIDDDDVAVVLPIPNSFGEAEMTDFQLLVVSGLQQCGFEGYFLTGSPYKIGTVANG